MSQTAQKKRDGKVSIHLAEDSMRAEISLRPPRNGGVGFTIYSVLAMLKKAGVTRGIDQGGLEKAILRCLTDEAEVNAFPVALGKKAKKSVPSYWHLKKRLVGRSDTDLSSPNVDYRENSPFVLVKKGEALAKRIPESPGESGYNVVGDSLLIEEKDIVIYLPGENIIEKDNVLYAACHGRFDIENRVMSVNETLDVTGNVDYSTGHIAFPGDVIIHGSVNDGFRVAAGKSIFVKQTMDATEVLARGDLVVEGGVKGRGNGTIRVGGRIQAKFIENCSVEAHGSIAVEKVVMHSNVSTQSLFDLGGAGILVGGETWARGGLRVGSIGRPESPVAEIRVGSDYLVDRKLNHIRRHIERIEAKINELVAHHKNSTNVESLIHQAEEALEKMRESERSCADDINPNKDARVVVLGKVDTGTRIQICDLSILLSAPMENLTFYYDDEGRQIANRAVGENEKGELQGALPPAEGAREEARREVEPSVVQPKNDPPSDES